MKRKIKLLEIVSIQKKRHFMRFFLQLLFLLRDMKKATSSLQIWVIPQYTFQCFMPSERTKINKFIQDSILEADKREVKVINLGLLNQSEDLNGGGELFLKKNKNLNVHIVDGSTLATAVVLNMIPMETREVFMCVGRSKVGSEIASLLSQRGVTIRLLTESREQLDQMKSNVPSQIPTQHHPYKQLSGEQELQDMDCWEKGK